MCQCVDGRTRCTPQVSAMRNNRWPVQAFPARYSISHDYSLKNALLSVYQRTKLALCIASFITFLFLYPLFSSTFTDCAIFIIVIFVMSNWIFLDFNAGLFRRLFNFESLYFNIFTTMDGPTTKIEMFLSFLLYRLAKLEN